PAISAGEPLVGILLGIIVFGDRIQVAPLQLAGEARGHTAPGARGILVAPAPAPAHHRTRPPHRPIRPPRPPPPPPPHPALPPPAAGPPGPCPTRLGRP